MVPVFGLNPALQVYRPSSSENMRGNGQDLPVVRLTDSSQRSGQHAYFLQFRSGSSLWGPVAHFCEVQEKIKGVRVV